MPAGSKRLATGLSLTRFMPSRDEQPPLALERQSLGSFDQFNHSRDRFPQREVQLATSSSRRLPLLRQLGWAIARINKQRPQDNAHLTNGLSASPPLSFGYLRLNQSQQGQLIATDALNTKRPGRFVDRYELTRLIARQTVRITLQSKDFDTYLQLVDAKTGKLLLQNDDRTPTNKNSALAFTVQPGARYQLRVTSYQRGETGRYTIGVQSLRAASTLASDLFNQTYGYGLVNAAAAVARAAQQATFGKVPDLGGSGWGLDIIKGPEVWAKGFTGRGVTVAVLDTGVDYRHPDLMNNLWQNPGEIPDNGIDDDNNGFIDDIRGWSFVDQDSNDPMDRDGHGTHVAGIIAAAHNHFGIAGVAPEAKIMPIRVIDGQDDQFVNRFDANLAAGVRYAVDNGARVLSMSLGNFPGEPRLPQTRAALQYARQQGAIAIMSSGNNNVEGVKRPVDPAFYAANNLGIAIGALNRRQVIADFSNPAGSRRLNFLVAPGVDVRSTIPNGQYDVMSGTSMAAPFVSGVVALMLSANPRLTPDRVQRILLSTANRKTVRIE